MFTRLLTFTGTDNIDAGVTYLRDEVLPVLHAQRGYRGVTASASQSERVIGILSLWDTAADRDASDSALGKARQEAAKLVGGDLSVETFELMVAEIREPADVGSALMVTRLSMEPAKIDENLGFFNREVLPRITAAPGFRALRNMINRQSGEGVVGSAWADQEAMMAASEQAMARRPEAISRGVNFGETSYREIVFADLR
jgi:heme-degrading monooxygenase HmoA